MDAATLNLTTQILSFGRFLFVQKHAEKVENIHFA